MTERTAAQPITETELQPWDARVAERAYQALTPEQKFAQVLDDVISGSVIVAAHASEPTPISIRRRQSRGRFARVAGTSVAAAGLAALFLGSPDTVSAQAAKQPAAPTAAPTRAPLNFKEQCPLQLEYRVNGNWRRAFVSFPMDVDVYKQSQEGGKTVYRKVGSTRGLTFVSNPQGHGVEMSSGGEIVQVMAKANSADGRHLEGASVESLDNGYNAKLNPMECAKKTNVAEVIHPKDQPVKPEQAPKGMTPLKSNPPAEATPSAATQALRDAANKRAQELGMPARPTPTVTPPGGGTGRGPEIPGWAWVAAGVAAVAAAGAAVWAFIRRRRATPPYYP
ncbi:hypothetical protein HYS93_00410 [Candidatus Daviesbacteria bacterium]|nr:hypothetical protein [Candidatus Daviesbacteria bacterium]